MNNFWKKRTDCRTIHKSKARSSL